MTLSVQVLTWMTMEIPSFTCKLQLECGKDDSIPWPHPLPEQSCADPLPLLLLQDSEALQLAAQLPFPSTMSLCKSPILLQSDHIFASKLCRHSLRVPPKNSFFTRKLWQACTLHWKT